MMFAGLIDVMAAAAALATCWPLIRHATSRWHIAIALFIIGGSLGLYTFLGSPDALKQQVNQNEVDDVMSKLKTYLAKNPGDTQAWRMLGWSMFKLQNWPEAIAALEKAAALAPDDAKTKTMLAQARAQMGGPTEIGPDQKPMIEAMVARLSAKLQANPQDVDGWLKLIRSYDVLQNEPKLRETILAAVRVFPEGSAEKARILEAVGKYGLD